LKARHKRIALIVAGLAVLGIGTALVLNAFNSYGLAVNGAETLDYIAPRRFRLLVTTEF